VEFGDGVCLLYKLLHILIVTFGNFVISSRLRCTGDVCKLSQKTITITGHHLPTVTALVKYCAGASDFSSYCSQAVFIMVHYSNWWNGSTARQTPSPANSGTTHYVTQHRGCESHKSKDLCLIISGSALSVQITVICVGQSATLTATPSVGGNIFMVRVDKQHPPKKHYCLPVPLRVIQLLCLGGMFHLQ
jgi:hypothetical protein